MLGTTLLMVVDDAGAQARGRVAAELTFAAVLSAQRAELRVVTVDDLVAKREKLSGASVAWLRLESPAARAAESGLLGSFQEMNIPVAVGRAGMGETAGALLEAGVVACPLDADPATAWAVLSSLLSMVPMLQTLAMESKLLKAQSEGVAGQFDKIDEELRMAVKIQREFLPKALPSPEGVAFDVMWRPACYVSGDIYNVMRLDEHHVGIFIADAVGHGVPAALVSIFIKQSIKTKKITPGLGAGYRILPPGEALASLNRAMIELDAGNASLGTAAYAVIDTRTQRLTLARAGHPAPLLLRGNGRTQWLEPDGAMLGIFPEEIFEDLTIDLEDGDRFLLYSDGFEVAFPGCDENGKLANEHYAKEFQGLRDGSGQEALDILQGRLDQQTGSLNQRDDLTVICSSVKTHAHVAANRAEADRRVEHRSVA